VVRNYFKEFRFFQEDKAKFVNTVKKQLNVPKKLWLGMPVVLSNVKIGDVFIRSPKVFYVTDFDDSVVTIRNVSNPMNVDTDGEIDLDKSDFENKSFVLPRQEFYNLLEPQGMSSGGGNPTL